MVLGWVVLEGGVTNECDVLCCSEGQAELSGVSSNVTPSTSLGPDQASTTDISQIITGISGLTTLTSYPTSPPGIGYCFFR